MADDVQRHEGMDSDPFQSQKDLDDLDRYIREEQERVKERERAKQAAIKWICDTKNHCYQPPPRAPRPR